MGRTSRNLFAAAFVLLLIAVLGLLISHAWYADDECPIAQWKCDLGGVGLAAFVWGGILGLLVLMGALLALISAALGRTNRDR